MMLLFVLALATVSAINLPTVTVDKSLLEKYGVTKDVNQPKFADDAYAKFKKNAATIPGGVNIDSQLQLLDATLPISFPVHLSKQIIYMASFVKGDELMMAVTAHSLNVWQRFQKTAAATSTIEFATFKKLENASNITVINICRKERHILELAHVKMREFNPVSACDKFLEDIRKDSSILKNRMDASLQAHKNLDELEKMINKGDVYNFFMIKQHLELNPVIDPFMYEYFKDQLKKSLEDYSQAVEEMSKDEDLKKVVSKVTQKIGDIALKME